MEKHIEAHKFSWNHRAAIEKDVKCGCFYCLKIFSPSEIVDWIPDKDDDTAVCPYCGIDSVIGESSGYPITTEFLSDMKDYWFLFLQREKEIRNEKGTSYRRLN